MKKFTLLLSCIAFLLIGNIQAQTIVAGGNIESNTTWSLSGSPYLIQGDITVNANVTLTIQPDVVVKFNDYWAGINVYGSLNAIGTANDSIFFTSIKDDVHGGDSNGDGTDTSPAPDQWSAIQYFAGSTGSLKYCFIGFGGGEGSASINIFDNSIIIENNTIAYSQERGIYVENASPDINNNLIKNNLNEGIYFTGFDASKTLSLSNNTFLNNHRAIFALLSDETADITLINNQSTGADAAGYGRNGFNLQGTIAGINTFTGQAGNDFPFILYSDLNVNADASLTITEGTTVKFEDYWAGINVYGTLIADGTSNDSIIFTALADDAHGGDCNGDGSTTTPASNQWSTVQYLAGSSGSLNYCFIGYGGGEGSANIHVFDSDVDIENCTILNSEERGIYVENASPDINNNLIKNNLNEGIYFTGFDASKALSLSNNIFLNNHRAVFALLSDETADITLINNQSTGADANGYGRNGFNLQGTIAGINTFTGQAGNDFPFILYSDLNVNEDASLTITEGSTVKFEDYWAGINVYGTLIADGTTNDSIIFTSVKDDAHGGDSNGDGTETAPASNQWSTVQYLAGSSGSLKYCFIGYGGGEGSANIHIFDSDVDIENCTILNSEERGIYVENASPDINNNLIKNNLNEGVYFTGFDASKTLSLSNNIFLNNHRAVFALLSDETADITLINNQSTGADANGYGRNGFNLQGTIAGTNTFTGQKDDDFPFILYSDLTVKAEASLTITEGTKVKFEDYWAGIDVYGDLSAIGTENDSIIFTSIKDDAHGGDSNGDGTATTPASNLWSTIQYNASSTGGLKYCFIGYGGGEGSANIHVWDSDVEIEHNTILHSEERGIYVDNASPDINYNVINNNLKEGVYFNGFDTLKALSLNNNIFLNNNKAIFALLSNETADITLINNESTGADANGYGRNGFNMQGTIAGTNTYTGQTDNDFPFIIQEGDINIQTDASLTLTAGSKVKFENYWSGINVYGTLIADGTSNDSIVFTALADDAHGGDCNGDGTTTTPASNQWSTVQYLAGSSGSLKYCFLGYGGGEGSANIHVIDSDVDIEYCTILNSEERGIYVENASPEINYNVIANNLTEGIYTLSGANPIIRNNNIYNNTNYGIFNADASLDVDALNNWWGDASGPYHADNNPNGIGNSVSDHVLFSPWYESPVDLNTSIEELSENSIIKGIWPNPVDFSSQVTYHVETAGRVSVRILDLSGRTVLSLLEAYQIPGEYTVPIDGDKLTNGVYLLCFETENNFQIQKFIKQ